jgi:hypothetical protein
VARKQYRDKRAGADRSLAILILARLIVTEGEGAVADAAADVGVPGAVQGAAPGGQQC